MGPPLLHVCLVIRVGLVRLGGRGRGGVGARDFATTCTLAQHVRYGGGGGTTAATAIIAPVWITILFFPPVALVAVCQWRKGRWERWLR